MDPNDPKIRIFKYFQNDPEWKGEKMVIDTLGNQGCFITSLANCFYLDEITIDGKDVNPKNLLDFIKRFDKINKNDEIYPDQICDLLKYEYQRFDSFNYDTIVENIEKYLQDGWLIIIQIQTDTLPSHFMNVKVVDTTNKKIICHDPLIPKMNNNQINNGTIELDLKNMTYRGKKCKIKSYRILRSKEQPKKDRKSKQKQSKPSYLNYFLRFLQILSFAFNNFN